MICSSAMRNVGSHGLYTWIDICNEGHSWEAELLIGSVYRVSCGYMLKIGELFGVSRLILVLEEPTCCDERNMVG